MANIAMWKDKQVRAAFEAKAKARFLEIQAGLAGQAGVVAIEPESGDYFVGATLGKANNAAYVAYPDAWCFFVRLDNPTAALALPTW
jgi:hypothetical protein